MQGSSSLEKPEEQIIQYLFLQGFAVLHRAIWGKGTDYLLIFLIIAIFIQ